MPADAVDPAIERTVRESFSRQGLMTALGAVLVQIGRGEVHVELPFGPDVTQQNGVIHAGAIAAVADTACGYAALTMAPSGSDVVSVEFKLNLLAPARGGRLAARARVIRSGRSISVCQADVFSIGSEGETLVAIMLGTMLTRS